jgi:hypothetical protein
VTRPTRATVDGRAFLDLRARANADGRPVDEYLTLYALEGFLQRLSRSPHCDRFVLKGGVLLAAFDERRPTRDVDLAGLQFDNAIEKVTKAIIEIASIEVDDGLAIATDQASAETIREDSAGYTGVRISLPAALASARVSFHVDVNVGDPIEPAPEATAVPRILGGTINVLGYSVEMVIAEKLVTVVQRGTANTRWRDFVDLHRIVRSRRLPGAQLVASTRLVADHPPRDARSAPDRAGRLRRGRASEVGGLAHQAEAGARGARTHRRSHRLPRRVRRPDPRRHCRGAHLGAHGPHLGGGPVMTADDK